MARTRMPQKFKGKMDLSGFVFGRLSPVKISGRDKKGDVWECQCSCGSTVNVQRGSLLSGNTKSCGCLRRELVADKNKTHSLCTSGKGDRKPRIYNIWSRMRQRCNDKNSSDYSRYGGRGIFVCEEWSDFKSFYDWSMANGYSDKLTIERIENSSGYSPENCKWIKPSAQAKNKRNNHLITYKGQTKILADWARVLNVESSLIRYRLKKWGVERALSTPIRGRHE